VGLDATTKGPSPLVGESKVSRESTVSCSENNYFAFLRVLHTNKLKKNFNIRHQNGLNGPLRFGLNDHDIDRFAELRIKSIFKDTFEEEGYSTLWCLVRHM
jgi:hypothetical protein